LLEALVAFLIAEMLYFQVRTERRLTRIETLVNDLRRGGGGSGRAGG